MNKIHNNHCHKFSQASSTGAENFTSPNNFSIKLPFPPTIRASDIAKKRLRSRICSKSPNAFFVYRKAFVDQLSKFGGNNKLKMTEVSRLVSSQWKLESKQVKIAYEEIAKQVEKELNDMRNKDLVYANDYDNIGRRKKNKNKRGRRSNSEFGSDFFMSIKGANFNISTLDFSVKPSNNNNNNHSKVVNTPVETNNSSNYSSLSSSPLQSNEESVYLENLSSADELSIPDANITYNNIQQFQFNQNSPISEEVEFESIESICDLTPPNYYNDYMVQQYQPDEFELREESFDENLTYTYPAFEDRSLDYYLSCFDNLS